MSYLSPKEFVKDIIDLGESKILLSAKQTLISSYLAGAILALAAAFAISVSVNTGSVLLGAVLFPVGFIMLNLLGLDLLTGMFVTAPLALLNHRKGVSINKIFKNWLWVFIGNFLGALSVVFAFSFFMTYGYSIEPNSIGLKIASIGESRTLGYAQYGLFGWLTVFIAGVLCNWMVSMGVVGSKVSKSVGGKAIAMWMPIMLFFYLGFEHAIVNMFLFPMAIAMGADFSLTEFFIWNEIPVLLGNLVGGLLLTGLPLYSLYAKKLIHNR